MNFVCVDLPPLSTFSTMPNDFSPTITEFPSGEDQLTFPNKPPHIHTAVIRIDFKQDVHRRLYWLWLAVQTLRDLGFHSLDVIAPYLPYQRQQRPSQYSSFGGQHLFRYLNQMSLSHLTVLDCHDARLLAYYQHPLTHIMLPALLLALPSTAQSDIIITPDNGAYLKLASHQHQLPPIIAGQKTRAPNQAPCVHFKSEHRLNHCQRALIVDDIYDSGATLEATLDALKPYDIKDITIFITHILSPERYQAIQQRHANVQHLYTAQCPKLSEQVRPCIAQIS